MVVVRFFQTDEETGEVVVGSEDWDGYRVRIVSRNTFPTAAGLASSAAGLACLSEYIPSPNRVVVRVFELFRLGRVQLHFGVDFCFFLGVRAGSYLCLLAGGLRAAALSLVDCWLLHNRGRYRG